MDSNPVPIPARIIPADAGSTADSHRDSAAREDHPRRCGEHFVSAAKIINPQGSSPQMRGALCSDPRARAASRIIPADAGSTLKQYYGFKLGADHPRRCGEHVDRIVGQREFEGSSPQMRGALRIILAVLLRFGIIPADAGSTMQVWPQRIYQSDHPRRCGEHLFS